MRGVADGLEKWGWRLLMPALLFGGVAAGYVLLVVSLMRLYSWRSSSAPSRFRLVGGAHWWMGYYALQFLGGLWSANHEAWALSLEVKAALLVLPLLAAVPGRALLRDFWWSVGWSVSIYLLWRVANAGWVYGASGDLSYWRYAKFSGDVHPTYLSLHATVAWLGLGAYWGGGRRAGLVFFSALLAVSLGLMGSKAGIFAAFGMVVLDVVLRKRWAAAARQPLWASLMFLVLLVSSASVVSRARFVEMASAAELVKSDEAPVSSSSAGRVAVWRTAFDVLGDHPFGVGTGDVTDELMVRYNAGHVTYASERRLNPHNQWLQAGVAFGWPGVLLVTLALGHWCLFGWSQRSRWLLLTGGLVATHAMVESVLETQRGVVFVMWMFVALQGEVEEKEGGSS